MDAATPITDVPLVAMDFETTGLDPKHNDILSIGLVPLSLQRIRCREARHWLVSPPGPLPEASVVIHGITPRGYRYRPRFPTHYGGTAAGPGRPGDGGALPANRAPLPEPGLLTHIGEQIEFPVIDTFELERRAMEARRGWIGKLMGRPLGSLRLGDSRRRYSLPGYPPHHALTDALATAELLQAQVAHHYRPDTPVGNLWC